MAARRYWKEVRAKPSSATHNGALSRSGGVEEVETREERNESQDVLFWRLEFGQACFAGAMEFWRASVAGVRILASTFCSSGGSLANKMSLWLRLARTCHFYPLAEFMNGTKWRNTHKLGTRTGEWRLINRFFSFLLRCIPLQSLLLSSCLINCLNGFFSLTSCLRWVLGKNKGVWRSHRIWEWGVIHERNKIKTEEQRNYAHQRFDGVRLRAECTKIDSNSLFRLQSLLVYSFQVFYVQLSLVSLMRFCRSCGAH